MQCNSQNDWNVFVSSVYWEACTCTVGQPSDHVTVDGLGFFLSIAVFLFLAGMNVFL